MAESFSSEFDIEAAKKRRSREADLRSYLLELVEQGILVDIRFRESHYAANEDATYTVERVQEALEWAKQKPTASDPEISQQTEQKFY